MPQRTRAIRIVLLLVTISCGISPGPARAEEFHAVPWRTWQPALHTGLSFLARVGRSESPTRWPNRGDLFANASAGMWFHHFIELHAVVGYGIGEGTLMGGGGARLNLIESFRPRSGHSEMMKGLFRSLFHQFMFYAMAEVMHYEFPEPTGEFDYDSSVTVPQGGLGFRWYPVSVGDNRFYLDATFLYSTMNLHHFVVMSANLGMEF